jgi:hypothetical protein
MKAYLNRWIEFLWLLPRFCRTYWNLIHGRWHIFRDQPTWFVARCAALDADTEALAAFVAQAQDELRVRGRAPGEPT